MDGERSGAKGGASIKRRSTISLSEGKQKRICEVLKRFRGIEGESWWQSWEMVAIVF